MVPAKSGVEPSNCVELAKHIEEKCPNLHFSGFMTIGNLDYTSTPENFKALNYLHTKMFSALVGSLSKLFMTISSRIYESKVPPHVILTYFCEYLSRTI